MEAEGKEMHWAESFSPLSRKKRKRKPTGLWCCVSCGALPGRPGLQVPKGEQEGASLRPLLHLDRLTGGTEVL